MTNDIQTRQRPEISDGSFDFFAPLASESLFWPARYVAPSPMLGALPLLFWLTESIRPRIGVTIGLDDPVAHFGLCQAVQKLGLDAMCFGIAPEDSDVTAVTDYNTGNYAEFSQILRMDHGSAADLLEDGEIDLLIVARPADMPLQDDIDMHWLPRISGSGAILFLAGGESLGSYCERISQGAGCFTLDREKGIYLALSGDRHNDRLKRLCQLRIGRPGYLGVRNVFTRLGELHSNTAVLNGLTQETRTAHSRAEAAAAQVDALKGEMQALCEKADEADHQNEERFNDIAILGLELHNAETELQEARTRADSQTALLERSVHDNNEARAAMRAEMDAKQQELSELRAQMEVLRDILREAELQRDEARHRVTDLEHSSSWRITAPLRRASALVRRDGHGK